MTADDWMWLVFRMVLWLAGIFACFQVGRYLRAVVTGQSEDTKTRLTMTNLRTKEELNMATYTVKIEFKLDDISLKEAIEAASSVTEEVDNQSGEMIRAVLVTDAGIEIPLE